GPICVTAPDVLCRLRFCQPVAEVRSVHSQPAPRSARLAGFERLHAEGRRAVLAGTHQVECAPANGGAPDAGYFADPGCGAGGEDDDVTPAVEVVGRP